MKPSTFLYALGLAELGLAMPVPMTISDMVSHVKGEARRLTRITRVSMHRARPVAVVQDAEQASRIELFEFDNHPVSPSRVLPPSVVLAAPRPLKTDYLQSLAKHPQQQQQPEKDRVVDVVGDGTPETIRPMTLKDGLAELMPSRERMPCWKHVQVPQPTMAIFEQHPDLIVLGAVIALVLILLVLETVGNTFQGVRSHYTIPQGEIRLEGDEKPCKAPSFRSDMAPYNDEDVERQA
ncbi:hypothetical protein CkaCkLH20_02995 [Colletotrichum karsti]|uniref:Transmembrane protein n=1 Tax=Colletotrichum karsti TaxID=1095194 RepID=A0A9P6LPB7_9PEZI|nr:uncharacterized protein CkaCkLH20_02995 [Colletotrichum karsti]KAF9879452.1 hypothetical protein CkaCkLH20_02995 [Colletotrichum karsti]